MVVLELAGGVRRGPKAVAHGFGDEIGDSERLLPMLQRQYCDWTKSLGRRRAASVLMPLAREATDVLAEVRKAWQRGRTTACAKRKSSEEAFRHKLFFVCSEAGKSSSTHQLRT